jgi:hypothetical protein
MDVARLREEAKKKGLSVEEWPEERVIYIYIYICIYMYICIVHIHLYHIYN